MKITIAATVLPLILLFGCGDNSPAGTDAADDGVECDGYMAHDFPCGGNGYCEGPTRIRECVTRWWGPEHGTPCNVGGSCERGEASECPDGTACFGRVTTGGPGMATGCIAACLPLSDADADADVNYDAWPGCYLPGGCQ